MDKYLFRLGSLAATKSLADSIASVIIPNFVVALNGELGAGKTTLVRYILQKMGIEGTIKSPTYTLVEPYQIGTTDIYHFDLYRFNSLDEWFESGFDEYFVHHSICFIEWAEKALELIPVVDWNITITVPDSNRIVEITPNTAKGRLCLTNLIQHAAALSN